MKSKLQNLKNPKFLTLAILLLFTFLIKIYFIYQFDDADWEPDSYMHFVELGAIFKDFPNNLDLGLGVWTKPLYAYPFGLIVYIFDLEKMYYIQVLNTLIIMFCSVLVYKTLKLFTKSFSIQVLAILFTNFSLLLFKASVSSLTEPIFTLCLVLGMYFISNKKYYLASFVLGLSVLARIEGLYFVGIYALWILYNFRHSYKFLFKNYLLACISTLLWNFAGYLNTGMVLYIFDAGYPTEDGRYGFGSWLRFPKYLLMQEPIIIIFFLIGAASILFYSKKAKNLKEQFLFTILPIGFVLIQMFLWRYGKFGSAGLMRYLVSVMPFIIVISVIYIEKFILFFEAFELKKLLLVSILGVTQILIFEFYMFGIPPISKHWPYNTNEYKEAGKFIKENLDENLMLYSERPEAQYYAERDTLNAISVYNDNLDRRDSGIYVWSKEWGEPVLKIKLEEISSKAKLVYNVNDEVYVFIIP